MDNTKIISDFTSACNALAEAVNQQLFSGLRLGYWVAHGSLYDFGVTDLITTAEMLIILQQQVTFEEYYEWTDFNLSHCEQEPIPLSAWLKKHRGVEKKEKE